MGEMRRQMMLLAAMAAFSSVGSGNVAGIDPDSVNAGGNKPPAIPKGMQEFYVDGYRVYAINEKNARKKANKLKAKDNVGN